MSLALTILGGYLGAGKTSVVNHLLRHAGGRRLAVLVNEFGTLPIDEDLIEAEEDDVLAIAGGCVCCSYGNELVETLMRLAEMTPAPDHVVLEASGVALPGAIAASVSLIAEYRIDGIVTLTDAETIEAQGRDRFVADTVLRQLSDADLIVLNKIDLVSDSDLAGTRTWLEKTAPEARVIEARHGGVPPAALLGIEADRQTIAAKPGQTAPSHAVPFATHSLAVDQPVAVERLAEALTSPALGLVRAKGFVRDVGGKIRTLQTVGRRSDVSNVAPGARRDPGATGLVVIGLADNLDLPGVHAAIAAAASQKPESPT